MASSVVIKSYRPQVEARIMDNLEKGTSNAGMIVAREAKKNVTRPMPSGILDHWWKDTGILAGSIANEGGNGIFRIEKTANEISVLVGTKVVYGFYLEVGALRKDGSIVHYPWLFPAVESKRPEIIEAIKKGGGKVIDIEVVAGVWNK